MIRNSQMRVMAQPPQHAKIKQADVVIDTNGTPAETEQQVREQWAQLMAHDNRDEQGVIL